MSSAKTRAILDSTSSVNSEEEDDLSSLSSFEDDDDAGKSFGELALINQNAERNATIVADEESDLLVINRELFNGTLKAKQEAEYRERRRFIRGNPLFRKWNSRLQKLLEMSLTKQKLAFDSYIVRQGEPVQGLHFIVKGQAKIVVEPGSHKNQYPKLFEDDSVIAQEFGRKLEKKDSKSRDSLLAEQIRVRRRQGYAAAERRLAGRAMDLCFVDDSEVIGDVEIILELPTYCQSIVCTSNCEIFCLDNKNIERFVTKRNQQTLEMLKPIVEDKLTTRSRTRVGTKVELFKRLLNKIEEAKPKKILGKQKEKEGRELMMSQLAKLYIENKTPVMVEPVLPDTVYYRTKSAHRAERKAAKARAQKRSSSAQQEEPVSFNVRLERAKRGNRRARSRRELQRLTAPPETHSLHSKDNGATRYLAQVGIDASRVGPANRNVLDLPDRRSSQESADDGQQTVDDHIDGVSPRTTEGAVFLTEVYSDGEEGVTSDKIGVVDDDSIRRIVQEMNEHQYRQNTDRSRVICSMVQKQIKRQPPSIQQLLRPKSAPAGHVSMSDDEEQEDDFDWETGNSSLSALEKRMEEFYAKFADKKPNVTELRRFQVQTPEDVPIPGGTVYVKQRTCTYLPGGSGDATGHSHVRRFMIPRHALAVASRRLIQSSTSKNGISASTPKSGTSTATSRTRPSTGSSPSPNGYSSGNLSTQVSRNGYTPDGRISASYNGDSLRPKSAKIPRAESTPLFNSRMKNGWSDP